MSLTQEDLTQIRTIMRDEIESILDRKLEPILGKLEAIENDVKEIYGMTAALQGRAITDENFQKKTLEEKLLTLNAELLAAAKQAGISLPRG
ncbi:MAG TPA: hypothetical protein VNQ73_15460 [Ilumatobacter sp.]|nr:hypothetical protein [Ilumatobacter sp.]